MKDDNCMEIGHKVEINKKIFTLFFCVIFCFFVVFFLLPFLVVEVHIHIKYCELSTESLPTSMLSLVLSSSIKDLTASYPHSLVLSQIIKESCPLWKVLQGHE